MDDLNTVNKILVAFQKNDIEKAEQLAQEIDDVALQSIWAVNVVLKYLELEDLKSALEVLNLVQDQSLKDIWLGEDLGKIRKRLIVGDRSESPCNKCTVNGQLFGQQSFDIIKKHYEDIGNK